MLRFTPSLLLALACMAIANNLEARADNPKLNEYSGENCDGDLLYHHSPPASQCVGIDARTKSVYLVNGAGQSNKVKAYLEAGKCDHGGGGLKKTWDVDRKNCFKVKFPGQGSGRVRDIEFPFS